MKMLDKAIMERVVIDYKDIYRDGKENNLTSAAQMPYFEGDFWPTVLEDSIEELHQEEREKKKQIESKDDDAEFIGAPEVKRIKKQKKQKKKEKNNKNRFLSYGNDLTKKLVQTMKKQKDVSAPVLLINEF